MHLYFDAAAKPAAFSASAGVTLFGSSPPHNFLLLKNLGNSRWRTEQIVNRLLGIPFLAICTAQNLTLALPVFTVEIELQGFEYVTEDLSGGIEEIMKTKFWSVTIALLALVLCGTAMLSYAQQNDQQSASGWGGGHRHGHMAWMAKELNLTDAQKQQIKTIMQTDRASMRPLLQQQAENRKAMLAATANGAFDQAKVQAIANQQAQTMAQLMVQKASIQHQIYTQVLTPDQRTKADQMREKQMARIDQRVQKLSQPATEAPQQQN